MTQSILFLSQTLPSHHPLNFIISHHSNYCLPPLPKRKLKSFAANHDNNRNINLTLTRHKNVHEGHEPHVPYDNSQSYYSSLIQECISSNSFEHGKSIHAKILENGFMPDTFLQTKILMLYARSGELSDLYIARDMFNEMQLRNSTSWNTMILGYSRIDDHKEVLKLFYRMQETGTMPDKFTFPSVVKAYVGLEDWEGLKLIHGLIIKCGLDHNLVVGGSLVDGYISFGSLDDAFVVFDEIEEKNVVSWNAVIRGYVRVKRWEKAWEIFYRMVALDEGPDDFSFATAIRVCGSLRCLDRGKQIHSKLVICGFESDIFVCNSLIDMYAKCRDSESCFQVFDQMNERDQVTWNSMISGEVQVGSFYEALKLFSEMQRLGFKIDRFNLTSILGACAGLPDLKTGREIHAYLVRNNFDSDIIFGSALVDMYSKCRVMEKALLAFERLSDRNEVSWNSLISGFVQEGKMEEAFELFHEMKLKKNAEPDRFTFTTLLNLCAIQGSLDQGKQIHAHVIRTVGTDNLIVETELVHMYAKCGNLKYSQEIFNQMEERNSYSWNSLIEGYEQHDQAEKALEVFRQMQDKGIKPDCFSLTSSISASRKISNIEKGKELHGFVVRNDLEEQGILRCVLVDMYAKCGFMDYADKIYNKTKEKDVNIENVMLSSSISCGRLDEAKQIFNQMEDRNTISWNSMLVGFVKNELKDETFELFRRMLEENVEFDSLTLVTLFNFCASLPALSQGEQLHTLAVKYEFFLNSVIMDSTLVDMYSKSGSIERARNIFDKMKDRNVISWNAMINGYAKHGNTNEVLNLYKLMQNEGIYPNDVTFLSVLSACSHTGKIEEGIQIFISMLEDFRIEAKAEHYTCMVDLLGRLGFLHEAKEVIEKMPVNPEVSTWGALLGACKLHQNIELGELAAKNLFEIDPQNPGHYVLLSNIYAVAGKWKEVEEVRSLMRSRGVKKEPGVSWIEIENEIQTFHAGDQSHPKTKEIYETLRGLSSRMKGLGYIPDSKFVLQNIKDDDEEEEYLLQHSERLAMGLGLISLPKTSVIRIFKNLRICGDCHTAMKFISKITGRKIVVRDTNRFHHFEDGVCSCGNFW